MRNPPPAENDDTLRKLGAPLFHSELASLSAAAWMIAERLCAIGWPNNTPRAPDRSLEKRTRLQRLAAYAEACRELLQALHEQALTAMCDLVRGRRDWKPRCRGDVQEPIAPPERRDVPASLWWGEHVEWQASAVWRETNTEVELYRSVRVRIGDIDRLWPRTKESEPTAMMLPDRSDGIKMETTESLRAPDSKIHAAICAAYDRAEETGTKPPNIKELAAWVRPLLREEGYETTARRIQDLGGQVQHRSRRRPAGKTRRSGKDLKI